MKPLNIISPWPKQKNGIADYAEQVSQYIPFYHNVITEAINYSDGNEHVRILHPNDQDAIKSLMGGNNLFHFGNNIDHIYEVPLFLKYNGSVVLHDISLHYLSELADNLIPDFFSYFLKIEHPEVADKILTNWRVTGRKISIDYQELNMISWLKPAHNIIVHSSFAAKIVKSYLPKNNVHIIPHFVYQSNMNLEKILLTQDNFKRKHAISDCEIIVSSVGFVTKNKQYDAIIKAFERLPSSIVSKFRFIIAGEHRPSEYDLLKSLQGTQIANQTIILNYLDEKDLTELLAASDIVLNLRYPTFGENSGSVARALGCGCIIAVSDGGSYSELDNNIFRKIPAKQDPSIEVASLLEEIAINDVNITKIRENIMKYTTRWLHPERICRQYMKVLNYDV